MIHWLGPVLTAVLFVGHNAENYNSTFFLAEHGIECWTDWLDRDDPSGTGDWETLSSLRTEFPGKLCDNPSEILAQTVNGVDFSATGQRAAAFNTDRGFLCNNCDQDKGDCEDYRIRLKCPTEFCIKPECWTAWLDVDDPSGDGDQETTAELRKVYPDMICDKPLKIQAQDSLGVLYEDRKIQPIVKVYDTEKGFICLNKDQPSGACEDFKVRFQCPADFCIKPKCFTEWFDRDDPSGSGDWEKTSDIVNENPGKICKNPISIEAQTTGGLSVSSTKNVINRYDLTGFVCKATDQPPENPCYDYRIRFLCPANFCIKPGCWTEWLQTPNSTINNWDSFKILYDKNPGKICDFHLKIEEKLKPVSTSVSIGSNPPSPVYLVRFLCPPAFCNVKDHGHYVGNSVGF